MRNARQDLVCANLLGHAFYSVLYPDPDHPDPSLSVNFVRFCFLDPRAREFYPDWESMADSAVNLLRTDSGRDPFDRGISDLVGELSTRSDEFRVRWARHNVRLHHSGTKSFRHPIVGEMTISFESLPAPSDPGLVVVAYTAEPGESSADALTLLAGWAAERVGACSAQPREDTALS
ncbi:putative transcriptional regulator [Pseudonocardia sp. Ae263_Ps1]|nr:putative transcriptional regulator [Pseudonocardia sp. Ae150A_Ps1]OLL86388.1 putative transcriptional regulator [Pseudonocardia sp. Ae263_Ps1]OLL93571.1 putative transcriptional regulator [Pseudonocardia sp. Ae356_Ps1]